MCPPAALAIGFGFGSLEVGSAIARRDYLTGRKMEKGERIQRGIFGALDMLPGVVVIAKQFEYGRKILNIVRKLKGKALNQIYDALAGNSRLRPALAGLSINYTDDVLNAFLKSADDVDNINLNRIADDVADINPNTVYKMDDIVEAVLKSTDNSATVSKFNTF